ncbi:MAG: enoyl-CoA hydratase/isomerase family protein [Ruminococcus sp.]|nr:enoyl-CoA hydratase/isomerase family protein [Ruminococcus sp.]
MSKITSNISTLEINNDIAVITIENGKQNLLSIPEFIELDVLSESLRKNPQVKALIITGSGRNFSYGADVSLFDTEDGSSLIGERLYKARKLLNYIEQLPIVTAAAINGGCFGGGLEVALSCQFRIASKKSILGLPETSIGVIPGMSGIERLTRLIGKNKAIAMVLSGEMLSSSDAFERGIVDMLSEDKNSFEDTVKFVRSLTDDRTAAQIRAVTEIANRASDSVLPDISDDSFVKILSERAKNENE